ncbi:hypothetical protein TeGR_g7774 [Tetraparma gracilis]|uniref:Uncharacterized protein n=1 Tax=Tetraparma gracilis TaxID=2962635 RepID=A0ABQ6M945_9STRA|nr:hypothetical protein TeGR_g7774 [Tetraparma gracilis]
MISTLDSISTTLGGIMLPDSSVSKPTTGTVLAAGPGRAHPHSGRLLPPPVPAGCNVLHSVFSGKTVKYDGRDCKLVRDDDVILTFEGPLPKLGSVRVIKDYMLFRPDAEKAATKSGIAVAAAVSADLAPCTGTLVLSGPGRVASSGLPTAPQVREGERAKWKDYAGQDVSIEGVDYVAVRMVDVLSVLG